jgi:D-serine deaminase-like pyridoxal phosphate-dependent protein
VGEWFRDAGVDAVTVSSVEMAASFACHGWRDITVAFPVNVRELREIDELAARIRLGLLVDSAASLAALSGGVRSRVRVFVKIDTGYGRAGISWNRTEEVADLVGRIRSADRTDFAGLLTHAGHSYRARSTEEVLSVHRRSIERLSHLARELEGPGPRDFEVSVGDTPTCSVADDFPGVDEIRPGNFVFYDLQQLAIGSCRAADLAVAVACPVVGWTPDRSSVVLYGGAVHLSLAVLHPAGERPVYGRATHLAGASFGPPDVTSAVISLSQEHGILAPGKDTAGRPGPGDVVLLFPAHACLTLNLHREYRTLEGRILRRG